MREIISAILVFTGCFFIIAASIGIVRFPDFYSRLHPAGKTDTLGLTLILAGLIVYEGITLVSVKLVFIIIFIFIANPTATHTLAKAAFLSGLKPWEKGKKDD